MKQLFIFILFVFTILTLTGCKATEGNVTPDLSRSAYSAEAEVQQLRAEIDDVGFWNSLDVATDMIKESLETHRDVSLGFRLATSGSGGTSGGETIILNDVYSFRLAYINDVWRSLTASRTECVVATDEQVAEAFDRGETVKVTGVIMEWPEYYGPNGAPHIISVVDEDADGQWDHVAEGSFFFTNSASTTIPGMENDYGAIGIIEVVPTNIVAIPDDEDMTMTLPKMAKLVIGN